MSIQYENKAKKIWITNGNHLGCNAHLHKEIEIVYMVSGESIAYSDTEKYVIHEGELFFSFPNKIHYYKSVSQEDYIILIFSPDFFPDFSNILKKQAPISPILTKEVLPESIGGIMKYILESSRSERTFREEMVKGYINVLLAEVIPLFEYEDVQDTNTDMLSAMLGYCMQHYTDNFTLDEIATSLHASKYYISRLFSQKIKMSFNDYINMLRINDAKERLEKTDDSITQIGIAVGYNTIRSFNRAFLAQTGVQPREYRAMFNKPKDSSEKDMTERIELKDDKPKYENIYSPDECSF